MDSNRTDPTAAAAAPGDVTFAFVKALAADLSSGRLEVPGFPDVVTRVRRALSLEDVTAEKLSRVIAADPALTAWVLDLANSAAFNASGSRISTLQRAIARVGFNIIRVAAMSFAMSQVRRHMAFRSIAAPLDALWQRTVATSAASLAISRRFAGVRADEALLAGVLSSIGRLYLLVRSRDFPGLFESEGAYESVADQWHVEIAKAVLENWQMPAVIVDAVHRQDDRDYEHEGPADMTDALILATVLVERGLRWPAEDAGIAALPATRCSALVPGHWRAIEDEIAVEIGEMLVALGA